MAKHNAHVGLGTRSLLTVGALASITLSSAVVASARWDDTALGAPDLWPWLLTGLQVLALWGAGRRFWWAWLLGGAVQLPWVAYALVTEQFGFVPGCLVSASVQVYSFLRNTTPNYRSEALG